MWIFRTVQFCNVLCFISKTDHNDFSNWSKIGVFTFFYHKLIICHYISCTSYLHVVKHFWKYKYMIYTNISISKHDKYLYFTYQNIVSVFWVWLIDFCNLIFLPSKLFHEMRNNNPLRKIIFIWCNCCLFSKVLH